jgi:hypothetical protein
METKVQEVSAEKTEEISDTTNSSPKIELSPEELKKLFDKAKEIDHKEFELGEKLEVLHQEKSGVIKIIHDSVGKGPFEYEGSSFTITSRKGHYYFKQAKALTVTKIG